MLIYLNLVRFFHQKSRHKSLTSFQKIKTLTEKSIKCRRRKEKVQKELLFTDSSCNSINYLSCSLDHQRAILISERIVKMSY
jgi:hypothetical protein